MKIHLGLMTGLAVILTAAGCFMGSKPSTSQLVMLEAELDAAITTVDMNEKSYAIYEHLDHQVVTIEGRIRNDLDPQSLALFGKASALWREYMNAEADLAYEEYKQGTIRTLMRNGVLIRLSKERLAYLQDYDPEGRYKGKIK